MSASLTGAFIGLLLGVASMIFMRVLAGRVELPETKRALTVSGIVQIVLLPILGWFAGSLLAGE
jgi:multisubunit Na+/H+ antiporter MnhB subunit